MNGGTRIMRRARWPELWYGILALLFTLGLPKHPQGAEWVALVRWLGSAILAFILVRRLRRPSPVDWYVAAMLSGYVLLSDAAVLPAFARLLGARPAPELLAIAALRSSATLAQLLVAVACWRARVLRHPQRPADAPAA